MANTKISQLTANTNPNGGEELVYAYNNANGKMSLDTMKTFASADSQPILVSGTNIKTINNQSILGPGNIDIQGGGGGGADASYDAIVDSSGDGDYTLVSAAIAAGKFNIFVKNGSYTETAGWDAYSKGSSFLRVIGESKKGVQITMPDTMTTANGRMIDMRYNSAADFYMENISFNITLTNTNNIFYADTGGTSFIVKNCSFVYDTTVESPNDTKHYLLRSNVVNYSSDTHYQLIGRSASGIYGCYFNTETTKKINIGYHNLCLDRCQLYSLAGRIQLVESNYTAKLYNCYVDAYELGGVYDIQIYNSYISVKGNVYTTDGYNLGIDRIDSSFFELGTLQNAPTISLGECTDSEMNFGSYDVSGSGLFLGMEPARINCRIICGAFTANRKTIGCDISATSLSTGSSPRIMGNRFRNTLGAITINQSGCIITGNSFDGTGAITISGNENVFTSNYMRERALIITGTDNEVANNVTA